MERRVESGGIERRRESDGGGGVSVGVRKST